jgi:hypothetical protein
MTKKSCIWCEVGSEPEGDYFWIHKGCFDSITSVTRNFETVEKYLKGELPRISKNGNKIGYDSVENFLTEMADFDRRWRNIRKLTKAITQRTPMEPFESSLLPSHIKTKDQL